METQARKIVDIRKKAAISAVLALLATEQAEEPEPVAVERSNTWGQSGRSQTMELRNLMQLRSLGRR
ncbi:hypothetical protein [Desulfoluna spongiiphila]|uniref:Uncharacterized protein n=1 Tax=Desulfoluna spongiiphila TaxID=419481 RepID=A0A1G5GTC0_9BACT|nr:hypothetical protein [Desulfoluna spongiiphila]SCY54734.1 hypothetical protein SAMN05216233_111120 [Desulfoluna spongiiphila]VVS92894.1 hypothetical protein DBB_24620 [Desulfoluna spongiiphila]